MLSRDTPRDQGGGGGSSTPETAAFFFQKRGVKSLAGQQILSFWDVDFNKNGTSKFNKFAIILLTRG
mgnify:CR=1 FL=1